MFKPFAYLRACFHHELYHGWFKRKKFFEGWYFKIVDKTGQHTFAFIPGIAMDEQGNKQAFIQVLDGAAVTATYHKFDSVYFKTNTRRFKVKIQENSFSLNRLKLQLPDCKGQLHFNQHVYWNKKLLAPGIMGWYSWVPFMECYHQVISMYSNLTGKLTINGREIDFTGGRAYIEKDWGRSFPEAWLWMQSNHFSKPDISFKLSVAKIPWIKSAFTGFICAFYYNNQTQIFATYTGAKLISCHFTETGADVRLEDKRFILKVHAEKAPGAELLSPILGLMDGRVQESMQAVIHITLISKKENRIIFNDTGKFAGLEIAGNTHVLSNPT